MRKVIFLVFFLIQFFYSCVEPYSPTGKENPLPPEIVSITPSDTQEDVSLTQEVVVVFSKEINKESVNKSSFNLKNEDGVVLDGEFNFSEDSKTVSFIPSSEFKEAANYYLTISRLIVDSTEIPLNLDQKDSLFQATFETLYSIPSILSVSVAKETPVSVSSLDKITIKFSEAMLKSSINKSTVLLTNSEGVVDYNEESMELTYSPNKALLAGYEYKLIVSKSVKDISGIELAEDKIVLFDTID